MENYFYLLLFLSFFISVHKFVLHKKKHKKLPPGPPSLPIIGHLHLLKNPLHKTLAQIADKYGPILHLQFGSRPVLVVSSPSAVEDCFTKNNDIIFANRPRLLMGKIMGNDYRMMAWAPYGPNWRNLRRISATEIFSSNGIQNFAEVRTNEVKSLIKRLSSQEEPGNVDMKPVLSDMALNMMMMMIAGKRVCGDDIEEVDSAKEFQTIVSETLSVTGASYIGDFLPFLRWVGFNGFEKRVLSLTARRDAYLQKLIEERRIKDDEKATLIDVLLIVQEKESDYYTDEMIRAFLWDLFGAGTDTAASMMEWALSLLLNNPDAIKKAQAEIDDTVQNGRLINESDLNKLPYLHSIILEALRMYPVGPLLIPHESSQECTVGGYNIPAGTILLVNLWAIQNNPKIWAEPSKFRPERFEGLQGTRDGFNFMPFGSGRRACPGEGFGMHVVGLTLGALIQCFDWERVGEEMVDMTERPGITLAKAQPLQAKCRTRQTALNFISQF